MRTEATGPGWQVLAACSSYGRVALKLRPLVPSQPFCARKKPQPMLFNQHFALLSSHICPAPKWFSGPQNLFKATAAPDFVLAWLFYAFFKMHSHVLHSISFANCFLNGPQQARVRWHNGNSSGGHTCAQHWHML